MLMVLTGAFEFWKQYNKEIVERESDDITLPKLIKDFPNLGENKKERPLSSPYALKVFSMHNRFIEGFCRLEFLLMLIWGVMIWKVTTWRLIRGIFSFVDFHQLRFFRYIVSRLLRLIEEMASCTQQLTFYSQV